jgi:predicted TIM-barrel fold metal-dependent hydrolase
MLVDADRHIDVRLQELAPFTDQPVRREIEAAVTGSLLPGTLGGPPDVGTDRAPEADCTVVFPGLVLTMTFHPSVRLEAAVCLAYARWLVEAYLPAQSRSRAMLYLPARDPETASRLVEEFGGAPGIVGAFVTNLPALRPFENRNMQLYALLEERALPLGFHPLFLWSEPPFRVFDAYPAAYAYAGPFIQSAHLMNWVLSGMPERFPGLDCVFYGAGIAWLHFAAHRLDQGFMRRASEAPLLRERPSHYMRRYFYVTHPIEEPDGAGCLDAAVRLIGPGRFLYGSNFPHWDFDPPSAIDGLAFLSPKERAAVLGANAAALFRLGAAS